jgi:acyl carrier protein
VTTRERILAAVLASIDELNAQRSPESRIARSPDTVLFGRSGLLDSMGLVNLIIATEQRIEDEFGVALTLADEHAVSMKRSPFRTIETLSTYIAERLRSESS